MYFYCIPSLLGSLSINMLVNELYKQEYLLKANFRDSLFNCSPKANSKPNFNTNFTLSDTSRVGLAHQDRYCWPSYSKCHREPPPHPPATATARGNLPELQALPVQLCLPLLSSSALWYRYGLKNNVKLTTLWHFLKAEMHRTRPKTKEIAN